MSITLKEIRKWCRSTHKWLGLVGLLFFVMMGATGVLLNHPDLIEGIDLPRAWLPGDYEYRDWNRASLRGVVDWEGGRYYFGEPGIWRDRPGAGPEPFNEGLPPKSYRRDVRAVAAAPELGLLLAATRGGLYARGLIGW